MGFALFSLGEYSNMLMMSSIIIVLFSPRAFILSFFLTPYVPIALSLYLYLSSRSYLYYLLSLSLSLYLFSLARVSVLFFNLSLAKKK
jgi:hypothetical protein